MKVCKSLNSNSKDYPNKKKKTFNILELDYLDYYEKNKVYLQDIKKDFNMIEPILIKKHIKSKEPRYGLYGQKYFEKEYSVYKGNQRVTLAKKLGYTHIEGVIINE